MKNNLVELIKQRRSIYALNKETSISKDEIIELVRDLVKHTPSAFNSQSARVIVLFDKESDKVWDITKDELRKVVPADSFGDTEAKLNSFAAGAGTILFFEDEAVVKGLQEQFALYADNFPIWSLQSSGMTQFAVWNGLASVGIGASLQHYNPIIDVKVKAEWDVPDSWKLISQMPFGGISAPAGDKEFSPIEDRVKVY